MKGKVKKTRRNAPIRKATAKMRLKDVLPGQYLSAVEYTDDPGFDAARNERNPKWLVREIVSEQDPAIRAALVSLGKVIERNMKECNQRLNVFGRTRFTAQQRIFTLMLDAVQTALKGISAVNELQDELGEFISEDESELAEVLWTYLRDINGKPVEF